MKYGDELDAQNAAPVLGGAQARMRAAGASVLGWPTSHTLAASRADCAALGGSTTVDFQAAAAALNGYQSDALYTSIASTGLLTVSTVCTPSGETPLGSTLGVVYYDETDQHGTALTQPRPYFCEGGHEAATVAEDPCATGSGFGGRDAAVVAGCDCWLDASPPPPPKLSSCGSPIFRIDATAGVCAGDAWPGCLLSDLRGTDFEADGVCEDGFAAQSDAAERPTEGPSTPTASSAYFLVCDATAGGGPDPDAVVGSNVAAAAAATLGTATGRYLFEHRRKF